MRQSLRTEVRQEAFKQYCEHLAAGNPKEAFHFQSPDAFRLLENDGSLY